MSVYCKSNSVVGTSISKTEKSNDFSLGSSQCVRLEAKQERDMPIDNDCTTGAQRKRHLTTQA